MGRLPCPVPVRWWSVSLRFRLQSQKRMGFGIPLLLLSFLSGAAQRWITRQFALRARLINVVSGLLLLGVGIYDLYINWSLLQVYLT